MLAEPDPLFGKSGSSHLCCFLNRRLVSNVFTRQKRKHFPKNRFCLPKQMFTGWILPASPINKSPHLTDIEGKHVKITARIEMYKGMPEIRINATEQIEVA
jgi:hypothetical protein